MKRLVPSVVRIVLLLFLLPVTGVFAAEQKTGDMNNDGAVTAQDAAALFRVAVGTVNSEGLSGIADVTGNLTISRADVRAVLARAAGRLSDFSEMTGAIEPDLLGEKYLDLFSYTGKIASDKCYRTDKVSVTVSKMNCGNTVCYVADVYVRDITCLRSAFSKQKFKGSRQKVTVITREAGAAFGITGDMYERNAGGAFVRNGEWFDENKGITKKKDLLALYRDGSMRVFDMGAWTVDELKETGDIWQLWVFGPSLLDAEGEPKTVFNCNSAILGTNPRSAIGYYEPGHYCLVVADGRQAPYSAGLRMEELSDFMYSIGCVIAYNLDGGQSAAMSDGDGNFVNKPSGGGRAVSDIVMVGDPLP